MLGGYAVARLVVDSLRPRSPLVFRRLVLTVVVGTCVLCCGRVARAACMCPNNVSSLDVALCVLWLVGAGGP